MTLKTGDKARIKTFRKVNREYPDEGWNYNFFLLNEKRKVEVMGFSSNTKKIKCEIIHPHTEERRLGFLDAKAIEKITDINISDELFEL